MEDPYTHIIGFNKYGHKALDQINLKSKEEATAYILDKGWDLKTTKVTEKNGKTYYEVKPQGNDWKIIKNHWQKMKEIPGFKEQFEKDFKYTPKPSAPYSQLQPPVTKSLTPKWYETKEKCDCEDKDFEMEYYKADFSGLQKKYNSEWEGLFNALNKTLFKPSDYKQSAKKLPNKKIISQKGDKDYYIYNKGKIAQKLVLKGLNNLSDWIEANGCVILKMERKGPHSIYVFVANFEDIAQFLPDNLIVQRFEDIINRKPRGCGVSEHNPYKDLEL